jgi:hypothetical protein
MAVFGPYTQPVKPAEWVDPLDLNMYAKGMMYKQEMAEKNLKSIVDTHSALMSLPAYGPDKQKLAEIDQQFRQQIGSMNISNLGDMSTMSQVKGVLGQYTTNADVLAIAQRGSIYKSMLEEKESADKKNKIYLNEGMDELNDYFQGEDYIQNLKFGNDGFTYEGAGDIIEQAKKTLTPDKKYVSLGGGEYRIVESYDPEKLKTAVSTIANSNPNWIKYHKYTNNRSFKDKNADDYAKQTYSGLITENESIIAKATQLKSTTKNPKSIAYYDLKIKEANEEIANTNKKLQNPYLGINFKNEMLQASINDDIANISEAMQFHAEGETKMSERTKLSIQLSNQIVEKQYDVLAKGAAILGLSPNQVLSNPSLQPGVMEAGLKYEVDETEQKEESKARAKQKVKEELLGKLGDVKIPSTQIITVGGVAQSKALWDAFIKKGYERGEKFTEGDKSNVAAIVKEFPNMFGLTPEQTFALTSDNIKIDSKGKIKVDFGFFIRDIDAGDFSKLATGVSQAGMGETSTSTTETGTSRISGGRGSR